MLLKVLSGVRFVMMSNRSDGGVTRRFQHMVSPKLLCRLSDRFVMMSHRSGSGVTHQFEDVSPHKHLCGL